jgi:hypothetical protein
VAVPLIYSAPPPPKQLPMYPNPVFAPAGTGGVPSLGQNPFTAFNYITGARQLLIDSQTQRPLVRIWDENMTFLGDITEELSVTCEELYNDSGQLTLSIRAENWLADWMVYDRVPEQDLHITVDPVPTMRSWQNRWGGKITTVNLKRDDKGIHTVELQATHNREHLKHLLFGANPVFPPELQIPTMWIVPWNLRTGLFLTGFINLARQFFPLLSIPDNIANPDSWISTDLADLNPLAWPIQWQFVNPVIDQSRVEVLASRWNDAHSVSAPLLDDAMNVIRAYTFIASEDATSPHPELAALIGNDLAMPTRNCIVLGTVNDSGVTGPTGTFADGWINLIASSGDDLITDVLIPQYNADGTAYSLEGQDLVSLSTPILEDLFLVAPSPPTVVYRDTTYSGIIESNRAVHGATAKTIMTGGHSPGWVNEALTFGIKYGLNQLQTAIVGVGAWGPGGGAGPAPVGAGLDELYQGQLSDTVLPFERYSDLVRELWSGDMAFLEEFEAGTGTAYTISGVLSLRSGDWKTRAYTSYKTTVRNSAPFIVNYDYQIGNRIGFQMANVIYTDMVSAIRYSWDNKTAIGASYQVSIGTEVHEIDPVSQALKALAGIWSTFGTFAGAQSLF